MKLYARRGFEWAEDRLVGLWSPVLTGGTQSLLLDCNPLTNNHARLSGFSNESEPWQGSPQGTLVNFPGIGTRFGDFGTSNDFAFSGRDPMSFSVWIVPLSTGSFKRVITRRGTSGLQNRGWQFSYGFGSDRFYFFRGDETGLSSYLNNNGTPTAGVLAHVVGTYDGSTMRMYVDGRLTGTLASTISISTSGTSLWAAQNEGIGGYTDFRLPQFSLYSRPLLPNEILSETQAGPGGMWDYQPPKRRSVFIAAGFKAYWARRQSQLIGGGV